MKKIYFLFLIVFSFGFCKAQSVTIPDANFVAWLQTNYAACMSGSQLDTTCPAITSATTVNVSSQGITDLTGIQYFDGLLILNCSNNAGLNCLPPLPNSLTSIDVTGTNVKCAPNNPNNKLNLPLCGDFNPNGCQYNLSISGGTDFDNDNNCLTTGGEPSLTGIKVKLFNSAGTVLLQQAYTNASGDFDFKVPVGNYIVKADTVGTPFRILCPVGNAHSSSIPNVNSSDAAADFRLVCKPGYDVGVKTIANLDGAFFPNTNSTINILAGDFAKYYNVNCNTVGLQGKIKAVISGPVTIVSASTKAYATSTVYPDSIVWTVTDFSQIDVLNDLSAVLKGKSTAVDGNQVCITVSVKGNTGTDNDNTNNSLSHCFMVNTTPNHNFKDVYPRSLPTGDWLTYTIHYENTGTISVNKILILDTLDNNLDPATFQVLAYNHTPFTTVDGKYISFRIPSINLPGGLPVGGKGYIVFRVKPVAGLPLNSTIKNVAYIYFDANPPQSTGSSTFKLCNPIATNIITSICQGESYLFNGTQYTASGTYIASFQSVGGCDSSVVLNLTVKPMVSPVVIISASPGTNIIAGTNVTFTASVSNGGSPIYQWKLNGNPVGSGTTYSSNTLHDGDKITLTVTSNASCLITPTGTSNILTITYYHPNPCNSATGGVSSPAYSVVCSNSSPQLKLLFASPGPKQWQVSDNNVGFTNVPGATDATYSPSVSQKQYFRCVTDVPSCFQMASSVSTVDVSVSPSISFSNVTAKTVVVSWTPYASGQYNVTWSGPAGSGSAPAVTTNAFMITGLNPDADLNVTVSPVTPCAGVNPSSAGTHTLCGNPTIINLNPFFHGAVVRWTAVPGASSYRVYFRSLSGAPGWNFHDVGGTFDSIKTKYGNETFAVYVAVNNCASSGNVGAGTGIYYVTTDPLNPCGPIPSVSATSNCPNQLTINVSGTVSMAFRRLSPSISAGASYRVSGPVVNITVGTQYAGSVWEVYANSVCGNLVSPTSNVAIVPVKQSCTTTSNVLISNVNCHGFIATWNPNNCSAGLAGYALMIKKSGAVKYTSYSSGLNTYQPVNWLVNGQSYDVEVISVSCNGSYSAGSGAQVVTLPICREDINEEAPPQDVVADNEPVIVYPNPATDKFYVEVSSKDVDDKDVVIEITNSLGQTIQTEITYMSYGFLHHEVNLNTKPAPGIYFVRTTIDGNIFVKKIMLGE